MGIIITIIGLVGAVVVEVTVDLVEETVDQTIGITVEIIMARRRTETKSLNTNLYCSRKAN